MNTLFRCDKKTNWRWLILLLAFLSACSQRGEPEEDECTFLPYAYQSGDWHRYDVIKLAGSAALNPNVQARVDHQGMVHIFYYKWGEAYLGKQTRYQIYHLVWNPETTQIVGGEEQIAVQSPNPEDVVDSGLDNCLVLDTAIDANGAPVVVYQGGDGPQAEGCTISMSQGELMINRLSNAIWEEYLGLGIRGDVGPLNPFEVDGFIGGYAAIAIDSQNAIHLCAQHYDKFCDWNRLNYPDLLYVRQTSNQLGQYRATMEEHVDDYNIYNNGGGVQSDMGYYCQLILDSEDNPFIFYVGTPILDGSEDKKRSLRMAVKLNGQWAPECIETLDDWDVQWLSAAVDSASTPAAAYFMRNLGVDGKDPDHLRFASRDSQGQWSISVVDNTAQCGDFCSLSFDAWDRPAIAYYDISARDTTDRDHKDLKYAWFDGSDWQIETVATAGDIGQYNTLWFDPDGAPCICTYELNEQQIVIFRKQA